MPLPIHFQDYPSFSWEFVLECSVFEFKVVIWMLLDVSNQFFRLPYIIVITTFLFGIWKLYILGFGSHQENCFLSFLQDNFLPIPYPMNSENPVSLTSIQRSWKRRVNVNTVYYFGIIICFSIMNFVLKTDVLKNLFDEHPIELKWHHRNGTLFADLRLISYLSFHVFFFNFLGFG